MVVHSDPRARVSAACVQKLGCARTSWQSNQFFLSAFSRCVKPVGSWLCQVNKKIVLEQADCVACTLHARPETQTDPLVYGGDLCVDHAGADVRTHM